MQVLQFHCDPYHTAFLVGHALLQFNDIEEAIKVLEDAKRSLNTLKGIKDLTTEFNVICLLSVGYAYKREWDKCKALLR